MKIYTLRATFSVEATSRREAVQVGKNLLRQIDPEGIITGVRE